MVLFGLAPVHPGPKVELVLGGGGALGFAELGALEWMEQHHIPVDYVFGTSAGAVFGGWYATGGMLYPQSLNVWPLSAIQPSSWLYLAGLRPTLERINWDQFSAGSPPFGFLTVRRKWELREYPTLIQPAMIPGLIPSRARGVLSRNELGLTIDNLTSLWPVEFLHRVGGDGFDDLPIPFRASTSLAHGSYDDLSRYSSLVIGDSVLPGDPLPVWEGEAIRASMAIPWIFTPVRAGSLVLADGGIVSSIGLGLKGQEGWKPDVKIALDVYPTARPGAATRAADVIYVPFIQKRFDFYSYPQWEQIAMAGYRMMEGYYRSSSGSRLNGLMLDRPDWLAYVSSKHREVGFRVGSVRSDGPGVGSLVSSLSRELDGHALGAATDAVIDREVDSTLGRFRLDSVGYYLEAPDTLVLHPVAKSYGPPFSLDQLSLYGATEAPTSLFVSHRIIGVNGGSEGTGDVSVGTDNSARVGLHLGSTFFAAPSLFAQRVPVDLTPFTVGDSYLSFPRYGGVAAVGVSPDASDEARVGLAVGGVSGRQFSSAEVSLARDTENFVTAPTTGSRLAAEGVWHLESPGMEKQFPQVKAEYEQFFSLWRGGVGFGKVAGGTSFGYSVPAVDQFSLGGFSALSVLRPGGLVGDSFSFGELGYRHRLLTLPDLFGAVYGVARYETGSMDGVGAEDFDFGVLADTKLGPIWLGAAVAEHRRTSFQIGFGRF